MLVVEYFPEILLENGYICSKTILGQIAIRADQFRFFLTVMMIKTLVNVWLSVSLSWISFQARCP